MEAIEQITESNWKKVVGPVSSEAQEDKGILEEAVEFSGDVSLNNASDSASEEAGKLIGTCG